MLTLARSNPTVNRRVSNFHDKKRETRCSGKENRWEKVSRRPIAGECRGFKGPEGRTAGRIVLFSGAGAGRTMILEWKVLEKG